MVTPLHIAYDYSVIYVTCALHSSDEFCAEKGATNKSCPFKITRIKNLCMKVASLI